MPSPVSRARKFIQDHGASAPIQLLTEADRRLAGRLVGHPAGFIEQAAGGAIRTYYRLRAPAPAKLKEYGEKIRRDGMAVLGKVLDQAQINTLLEMFERRIRENPSGVRTVKENGALVYQGFKLNASDPELPTAQTVMVPKVTEALSAATGTGFKVISYDIWRNHPLPSGQNDVYSNRWHTDGQRLDQFKVFFFLHDTKKEHGGTIIADRHKTREIFATGYRSRAKYGAADPLLTSMDEEKIMTGSAGHAYIFNPNTCLHRAGVPRPGFDRTVLMVTVVSAPTIDLSPRDPRPN